MNVISRIIILNIFMCPPQRSPAPHLRPTRLPRIAGYKLVGLLERIWGTGKRLQLGDNTKSIAPR